MLTVDITDVLSILSYTNYTPVPYSNTTTMRTLSPSGHLPSSTGMGIAPLTVYGPQ